VPDLLPSAECRRGLVRNRPPAARRVVGRREGTGEVKKAPAPGLGQRISRLAFAIIFSPEISRYRAASVIPMWLFWAGRFRARNVTAIDFRKSRCCGKSGGPVPFDLCHGDPRDTDSQTRPGPAAGVFLCGRCGRVEASGHLLPLSPPAEKASACVAAAQHSHVL
jgi:hypothetical protein